MSSGWSFSLLFLKGSKQELQVEELWRESITFELCDSVWSPRGVHAELTQMETIAVDSDEVLAAFARSLAAFHNVEYGTQLSEASFHRRGVKRMKT